MNHNRFSNGTFDIGPYDSTMDSSFYPKHRYNQDSNRYLGKMYDDNTIDDDESSTTAQMRAGNVNFNPAMNNKF
jgi:hypothetical protein